MSSRETPPAEDFLLLVVEGFGEEAFAASGGEGDAPAAFFFRGSLGDAAAAAADEEDVAPLPWTAPEVDNDGGCGDESDVGGACCTF